MKPESRKVFLETRARIIERAKKESENRSKNLKDMLFGCTPGNIKYYNIKRIRNDEVVNEVQSKEDSDGK